MRRCCELTLKYKTITLLCRSSSRFFFGHDLHNKGIMLNCKNLTVFSRPISETKTVYTYALEHNLVLACV